MSLPYELVVITVPAADASAVRRGRTRTGMRPPEPPVLPPNLLNVRSGSVAGPPLESGLAQCERLAGVGRAGPLAAGSPGGVASCACLVSLLGVPVGQVQGAEGDDQPEQDLAVADAACDEQGDGPDQERQSLASQRPCPSLWFTDSGSRCGVQGRSVPRGDPMETAARPSRCLAGVSIPAPTRAHRSSAPARHNWGEAHDPWCEVT